MKKIDFPHYHLDFRAGLGGLGSIGNIERILTEVVHVAGMNVLVAAQAYRTDTTGPWGHCTGLTGFIVLHESHAVIHTFEEEGWVLFDLFSCKPFSQMRIKAYLHSQFDIKEVYVDRAMTRFTTQESVQGGKDA